MRALYTAATGMVAQELNVQVISNNIANMQTTAYKKQRAEFSDLMYQNLRRVGANTSDQGTKLPIGLDIGAGVKTTGTPRLMTQGNLTPTGKELDVAIRGEGFFRVQMPDSRTAYTRAGSFEMDDQGRLVTPEGYLIDPAITFPQNASNISINQTGEVSALRLADEDDPVAAYGHVRHAPRRSRSVDERATADQQVGALLRPAGLGHEEECE